MMERKGPPSPSPSELSPLKLWDKIIEPPTDPLELRKYVLLQKLNIAHQVGVDQSFSLQKEDPPDNSIEKIVTEVVHSAFWDLFQQQISEDPPNLTMAISLLNEVKEGLFSVMLPRHEKLRNEVDVTLDLELIEQQAKHGALDIMYFAQYILSVMKKLCAPIRDDNISELMNETDIVALFRGILDTIKLMKLDIANFTLNTLKPELMSMEYERNKFSEYLELLGELPFTAAWLKDHVKSKDIDNFRHFLYEAFMDFLSWEVLKPYPETLILDEMQLVKIKNNFDFIVTSATIMLLSFNTIPPALSSDVELKKTIKEHICTLLGGDNAGYLLPKVIDQVKEDIDTGLTRNGMDALSTEQVENLKLQISPALEPDNRVRKLVCSRIVDYFIEILKNPIGKVNFPPALVLLRAEIDNLGKSFIKIIYYNINICIDHYQKLVDSFA